MDPMVLCSKKFPDKKFIHVSGFKTTENLNTAFARIYEGRFLTGILAGLTETRLGYVAAFPIPEVIAGALSTYRHRVRQSSGLIVWFSGINAFAIGARTVNPAATVHVAYTSTWYDKDTERKAAEYLLTNHSVRLMAQHQDTIEPQLAAQRHGVTSIGYNADMALQVGDSVLISLQFEWAVVYAHFMRQLLGVCSDDDLAATNATVCKTGWIVGEQYFPGYQEGAFSLTSPSWKVPAHAKAEMLKFQGALLQRPRGKEAVFCGPLASNSKKEEQPQLAAKECLPDGPILGMEYYVSGATVEQVFVPEKHIECSLGQRVERSEGKDPRCVTCAAGFYSSSTQASACTACSPGYFSSSGGLAACGNCGAQAVAWAHRGLLCMTPHSLFLRMWIWRPSLLCR
jgi:basic membrane protein A